MKFPSTTYTKQYYYVTASPNTGTPGYIYDITNDETQKLNSPCCYEFTEDSIPRIVVTLMDKDNTPLEKKYTYYLNDGISVGDRIDIFSVSEEDTKTLHVAIGETEPETGSEDVPCAKYDVFFNALKTSFENDIKSNPAPYKTIIKRYPYYLSCDEGYKLGTNEFVHEVYTNRHRMEDESNKTSYNKQLLDNTTHKSTILSEKLFVETVMDKITKTLDTLKASLEDKYSD